MATVIRGLDEEFAVQASVVKNIRVLSLNVEYLTLSSDIITMVELGISAHEMKQSWLLKAKYREEASKFAVLPANLSDIVEKLFTRTLWHPTSRMRLIQFLFHKYGVEKVVKAIQAR